MVRATPEIRALLGKNPFFVGLESQEIDRLLAEAGRRALEEDEVLFRQGDEAESVYAILGGRVRVVAPGPDGKEVVVRILQAGEIFGNLGILHRGRRTASVVAAEPCDLLVMTKRGFLGLLERHPRLAVNLLRAVSGLVDDLTGQLSDFALLPVPVRLARRLLALAEIYGRRSSGAVVIDARISQQELADWVGTSRETVNKHLRGWHAEGLIRLDRSVVAILDRARLGDEARLDPRGD